jgi:hypothetical protein
MRNTRKFGRPLGVLPVGLAVLLLLLLLVQGAALASEDVVGKIVRLQGEVVLERGRTVLTPVAGDSLRSVDVAVTGKDGRLEASLADGTVLTLGGDTRFVFRDYDFRPEQDSGRMLFDLTEGAFRIVTGKISEMGKSTVVVRTPRATIGIRGTDAWGGFLRGDRFGVLMVQGKGVVISNQNGSQEIRTPGYGVWVKGADAILPEPVVWKDKAVAEAVATVSFKK